VSTYGCRARFLHASQLTSRIAPLLDASCQSGVVGRSGVEDRETDRPDRVREIHRVRTAALARRAVTGTYVSEAVAPALVWADHGGDRGREAHQDERSLLPRERRP
jgi:hypothetical protein